jgi:hypothetical protein
MEIYSSETYKGSCNYHDISFPTNFRQLKSGFHFISNLLAIDDALEPFAPEWFIILLCQEDLLLLLNHATIKS